MKDLSELFWNASQEEFKRGYQEKEDCFLCLLCGRQVDKGIVYAQEGVFYEAERYMRGHIEEAHGTVFAYLINLDKKLTGLTDHQKALMELFYQGKSDREVQRHMDIGSASTIRNHRFVLKEKERQAKVFLALAELLKDKDQYAPAFIYPHKTAAMVDDRYNITEEEKAKIVKKHFPAGVSGPLKSIPVREKPKVVVLRELMRYFEPEQTYTEIEVNRVLQGVYEDYASLRRYLIDYGFLDRNADGSRYRVK